MVFVKIEGMLFFIVTFHQIVFYSLCFGRSWLLIHLMLKLIAVGVALGGLAARFNTSHVKVNQNFRNHLNLSISFNTSHVKVNPDKLSRQRYPWIVSIHPMLKLITKGCYHVNVCEGFQYIPC